MIENKKNIPETIDSKPLNDDQLTEAAGGVPIIIQPVGFKRCAANREHRYAEILDACPECGCKEFNRE